MLWWNGCLLGALPAQKVVHPGDWLYDALTALALEQGRLFFTGAPLTVDQVELMLTEINETTLSPSGMTLYERIHAALAEPGLLSFGVGALSFKADGALQPEFYFKSNKELAWNYTREERLPFLFFPLTIGISPYIALETELYLGENRMLSNAHDNYSNFPFDTMMDGVQSLDTNMPKRAYLSAGIPLWGRSGINFRLGMGEDFYGRTETGSVIFSDRVKGISYASLSFYSPSFTYSADIKQIEVNKYLYLHHLRARLFNRFSFALVEGVMVNAPFELRYLNPAMIFHGFNAWDNYKEYNTQAGPDNLNSGNSRVGSLGALILEARLWKTRVYGLAAMNQFEIPGIEDSEDSTVPNSLAFQLGFETALPVSSGYWRFGFEGVYTFPYMYILSHKNWSFYREFQEISNPTLFQWLGSPFGPDSIAGTLWAEYRNLPSRWSAHVSFLMLVQGENADAAVFANQSDAYPDTHAQARAPTPTGIPLYTWLIKAGGTWDAAPWLAFSFRGGYKIVRGHNHSPGKIEHGLELSLSVQFRPKWLRRLSLQPTEGA